MPLSLSGSCIGKGMRTACEAGLFKTRHYIYFFKIFLVVPNLFKQSKIQNICPEKNDIHNDYHNFVIFLNKILS